MSDTHQAPLAIVGAGLGGLSLALALQRAGAGAVLFERAPELTEVGAGIQMGPNVMRRLQSWGLEGALRSCMVRPRALMARDAGQGDVLATMPFDASFEQRFGAPYATIHRADLQSVLLQAVLSGGQTELRLNATATVLQSHDDGVSLQFNQVTQAAPAAWSGKALVGADGLWSEIRQQHWGDGQPRPTGHLAYRALAPQSLLPERLRSRDVTVWMGEHLHMVTYPVRGGEWLNLVLLVQAHRPMAHLVPGWDQVRAPEDIAADIRHALRGCCPAVRDVVGLIENWRMWPLYERATVSSPGQMARGRVALLGDAAHPMLPYLAQGAGMAIEDAECLARHWTSTAGTSEQRLTAYAQERWQRNARVQTRSRRNGAVFHATGVVRWGRNLSLRLLGSTLLDQPWLYAG